MSAFLGVLGIAAGGVLTIFGMVTTTHPLTFLGMLIMAGSVTWASAVSYHPPRGLATAAASAGATLPANEARYAGPVPAVTNPVEPAPAARTAAMAPTLEEAPTDDTRVAGGRGSIRTRRPR